MAAILQLRRGTTTPSLSQSELFFNTSTNTLNVGGTSGTITLVKIGSNTGNVTLLGDLSVSGTTILTTITGSNLYITENVLIDGNIHIGGHITLGSGSDGDLISVNASLSGSLIPDTNSVYDLGSISYKYRNLYVVSASIDNVSLPGSGILSSSNENFTDFSQSVDSRIIDNDNHISSIESFTGSQEDKNDTLATYTQSVDSDLTELFATASDHETRIDDLASFTGSYATTGSNTFRGTETISGSILVSGSVNADGFELDASTTTIIPVLNSEFNVNFGGSALVNKTLVLGDSKVLVAGRFLDIDSHVTDDIARFNSNGTLDTAFVAPSIGGGISATSQVINNFVTQSDDKIIIVGSFTEVDGNSYSGVARLNSNGTLDNTFTNPALTTFTEVRDVIIQNDDKIVVVGNFDGGIKRLNTDGTIDTSLVVNDSTGFTNNSFYAVALQTISSTDYLLVGGSFLQWDTLTNYKRIVRIGISGSLDTTYAGTNLNITSAGGLISKIKLDNNNDVYIAGRFEGATNRHRNIAKLTTDPDWVFIGPGELDSSFQTWLSGGTNDGWARDFDIVDGKVLIGGDFGYVGQSQNGTQYQATKFAIVNESDGAPIDNWTPSNYTFNNVVYSVTSLGDNNVLVGGNFSTVNSTSREDLASLKTSGTGTTTITSEYQITANTTRLLVSSSNTYFSGDVNIIGSVTASVFSGSFVGSFSGSLATQDGRLDSLELISESHDSRLDSLELISESHDSRLDQLEADSGSQSGRLDSLETFTSSQEDINSIYNSYTESNDTKWSTIQNVTSSILLFTQSADGKLDSIETYTHSLKEAIDVNGSDLTILGNLIVQGTQTSLNTTEVLIEDILLVLASGSTTSVEADGGGIFISGANSSITWNHSNQLMEFNTKVSSSVGFKGDGSELINIQHENINFGGSNILSGSGQIVDLLPSGVVSGSSQVTASLDSRYLLINGDDVVSGSAQISFNGITDKPTLVSGSSQVSYPNLSNIPSGIISGSAQIIPLLPNGVVSGSSQVKSLLPEGTISGSSQVDADSITNFDENVKDKLNSDGVISGSSFISNQQGSFTSSINGNETIVNLGLLESDTPTFQSINLESVELFGASQLTSLFLSSSGELGKRVLGNAAFLNVSASVGDDPNSIPTNKAVSDALIAAGAGDITAVNDSTLYTSDYLGLEHTGDGTLNGGYGQIGNVVIALATGSVKFTEGVVKALPSGLISSSDQVSITQSQITDLIHYTDSDTLNYINSRGVISGSSQILEGSGLVSSSNQINQLIVGTSFSESVDSRLDNAESANASGNDRLNALEFTSSSLNQFTSSIDITIKNKLNLDGVISGSSQLLAGSGIVSSSAQVSSYGVFAELNGDNLISSSQQIKSLLPSGVVSGSSQVDADSITNFDENVKDKLNVEGVISGSSQLLAGSGIVSSSAQISSYNTFLEINGDSVVSSSQQISDYNVFLEINGMGVLSGSDQVTGSLVDLISDQTISGTKTFTDIVVNGTGSFAYIQSTTGTAKIIGDSYIILNNDTPTQRYAGIAVYDSGSVITPTTASLNFDGQTNDWFYEYSSSTVDYGVVLFGPEYNTKGNPTYLTNNRIPKSEGSHHLNDSNISDNGTLITLGSAVDISGATNINNTTQSTSKTTGALIIDGGVGIAKTLNVGEDVVAYASSDRRLKDEITPIENSLEKINQIGGYSFVWNQNQHIYTGKDYGVIAQEIENILPELVETRENGYKAVKYDRLVSLLIEGIKELSKEVSELKNKIKE